MTRIIISFVVISITAFGCSETKPTPNISADSSVLNITDALVDFDSVDALRRIDSSGQPRGAGTTCRDNFQCASGHCITVDVDRVCSETCNTSDDCPLGWACEAIEGIGLLCFPRDQECEGIDLNRDPDHCGECNRRCQLPNAEPYCAAGNCRISQCIGAFHDIDRDPANGCEYQCTVQNDGIEACDSLDNDCDGSVDETTNLSTDSDNCGACGLRCELPNAVPNCTNGICEIEQCLPGFTDVDGDASSGCEEVEEACISNPEVCDGIDNDCDGLADETFDFMQDPMHCGGCGNICSIPGARSACQEGRCTALVCEVGRVDLDDNLNNGCECAPTGTPDMDCDGVDDDCDGRTDEHYLPDVCGVGRCQAQSRCEAGQVSCQPAVQEDERCNGLDDDCDGRIDETLGTVECGAEPCLREHPACVDGQPHICDPDPPQPGEVDCPVGALRIIHGGVHWGGRPGTDRLGPTSSPELGNERYRLRLSGPHRRAEEERE